jgi:predicted dehydrogenase
MALSVAECDAMVEAARSAAERAKAAAVPAPVLAVAYYRRGYPSVRCLRSRIQDGAIGTVRRMSINAEFPTSHRIDLVHYLLGPVAGVRRIAKDATDGYRFEQTMPLIHLETESGVEVRMAEQWVETGAPESIWIEGDHGALHLEDLKAGRLTILRGSDHTHEQCGTLPWTHWGLIENLIAHVHSGDALLCDGVAGRESTVILERIDEASTA